MSALLAALVAAQKADQAAVRGVSLGCLAPVLRAFSGKGDVEGAGRDTAAAVPGLVEQLTARELEILVPLAAARRTRASPNSWWSPWTRSRTCQPPAGQAGWANRTEVVTRARQLGPIP